MQGLQRNTANVRGREDLNMAEMDLTYVTERIVAVLFPLDGSEKVYATNFYDTLQMLENKHGGTYTIFNLSERRSDMHQLHKQVLDFGWPDALSPPLERLCSVCKSIDSWLNESPNNVAVLHCKGGHSRMAVVIAAYIDYSNICAGSDQELDQPAMRRFYDAKLARLVQPSQRRYVHYFAGLLSGAIKINNSPLFLHKIIIHGIPSFNSLVGCRPFIKIYQGMQPIYLSNVFAPLPGASFICITLDPCLQLRSDVLVKCFNKSDSSPAAREVIFRCQFHTCAISNNPLKFRKSDLDEACDDNRFPDRGEVEFTFTTAPERIIKPHLAAEIGSSLERWNSYENFATDSDDKTSYVTLTQTVSTSSTQGDPKFRLKSETSASGSFVVIDNSSFQSNAMNQHRSASVQERVAGGSLTSPQMPSKMSTNEQEQLDEILRELLGEDATRQDGTSLAPVSAGGDALVPGSSTITAESNSMQTALGWQTSHASVTRSALVTRQATEQPPPRGAKIESGSARYCETTSNHRPSEYQRDVSSFSIPYDRPPQQRETAGRSAPDRRHYASDSEDRASSLRERRSGSEDGTRRAGRQRQLASEDRAELKSAQSAYYRSKQTAQSDTEDGAASYRQYGPSRPFDDSVATYRQNGSYTFQHNPTLQESTANRSFQYNYETKSYHFPLCRDTSSLGPGYRQLMFGSSGPASPAIPERGESSREAVLRSQTGAREWLQSNEVYSTRCDDVSSWRMHDNGVEFERIAPPDGLRPLTPHERSISPFAHTTVIPKLVEEEEEKEEEEVISLHPIGRGIQSLELGSTKPSLSNFSANQLSLADSASLRQQRSPVDDPLKQPSVRHNSLNQFGNMQTLQLGAASVQQSDSRFFTQQQQNFQTTSAQRGAVQSSDRADQFAQFHQPTRQQYFTERHESSSTNHPSLADVQRNFTYNSYLHHHHQQQQQQQQGKSLQPSTSYSFPSVRQQLYFEMQGDRDRSLIVSENEGLGERQNVVRSGQYSYETMQQRQQHLQRHEQTAGSFGGIGRSASREFVQEMQQSPSLSSSVPFDRTQQESMRRLNSSMQNLLNAESAGSRTLTDGRIRAASVSKIEERGGGGGEGLNPTLLFVSDTSRLWHRENMTREEATAYLLDKPPGWFIIRNSNTYPGAYGLAVKVAQIPPNVTIKRNSQSEFVRHFLIEPTPTGVQLKGNSMEPVFGTLAALVHQHALTPMALPTKLVLPTSYDTAGASSAVFIRCSDSTTRLAGTYAAFTVLYINSVDVDSLSGAEAMSQAINDTFQQSAGPPDAVEVNFKVSNLGITLTDIRRKLFLRRYYPIESLTFCGFDGKDRRWNFTNESGLTVSFSGVFGFVARKQGCAVERSCHLFAELDPALSSNAIVRTISGMMSGEGVVVFPHS